MPTSKKNITDIARDFAEGNELVAALQARVPIAPTRDESRAPWVRRWLELSEWARTRELRELDRELTETLEDLRVTSDAAQVKAAEAEQVGDQMERFLYYLLECNAAQDEAGLVQRMAETKAAWNAATEALKAATAKRLAYTEAKYVVEVAQARIQNAQRHSAELRKVCIRTMTMTFLLTLAAVITIATLLYWAWATGRLSLGPHFTPKP
jgi:hypothetical protein